MSLITDKIFALPAHHLDALFKTEARLAAMEAPKAAASSMPQEASGNVAVIGVNGILFPRPNIFTYFGFGTPLTDIEAQISKAETTASISKIVFNFNSPGGSVTGINELANRIKAIKRPTVAYASGMAASAGYWLAAACDQIAVDATAELGSIGVVGVYYHDNNPNKVEIVSSNAPFKHPDSTTPEGRRILQSSIDDMEEIFIESLTKLRPSLNESTIKSLRGGIVIGAKAVNAGLADGVSSLLAVVGGQFKPEPAIQSVHAQAASIDDGWASAISKINGMNQCKTDWR